jgi:hypothetical protein
LTPKQCTVSAAWAGTGVKVAPEIASANAVAAITAPDLWMCFIVSSRLMRLMSRIRQSRRSQSEENHLGVTDGARCITVLLRHGSFRDGLTRQQARWPKKTL